MPLLEDDVCTLESAAWRFAWARSHALALEVAERLRELEPSGIFGDENLPTLWHEYCYEAQQGDADQLVDAWDKTVMPFIQVAIQELPLSEVDLLLVSLRNPDDQRALSVPEASAIVIGCEVLERLRMIAGEEDLPTGGNSTHL